MPRTNLHALDQLREPSQLPSHLQDEVGQDHGKEKIIEEASDRDEDLDVDEVLNDLDDDKIASLDSLGLAVVAHSQPAPVLAVAGLQPGVKSNQEKLIECYYAPPPPYPCICGEMARKKGVKNNLMSNYVTMGKRTEEDGLGGEIFGKVYSLDELLCLWPISYSP